MKPPMIKAVLFDCFGVLISDGLELLEDELLADDPAKYAEADSLVTSADRGVIDLEEYYRRMPALFGMDLEQYRAALSVREVKDPRILYLAKDLRRQYKTAILSNVTHQGFWRRFSKDELSPCFDDIVLSADIHHAKPEPEAYLTAAVRLGVRAHECVLIDDRQNYCDGAAAIGMDAIRYVSFEQLRHDLDSLLGATLEV